MTPTRPEREAERPPSNRSRAATHDANIIALNAAWLRAQEVQPILNEDELTAHIAQRGAQIPDREERRAEAEEEASESAPDFEELDEDLVDA